MKVFFTFFVLSSAVSMFSAAQSEARVDAVYSVPTEDVSLVDAASFSTRSEQNVYGSPELSGKLNFALPEELTGASAEFDLTRGANGVWSGTGTDGSTVVGTCGRGTSGSEKKWFACEVQFKDLVVDVLKRDVILQSRFGTGADFSSRLQVARQFEGQPIGVIKIRMSSNDSNDVEDVEEPHADEQQNSHQHCD